MNLPVGALTALFRPISGLLRGPRSGSRRFGRDHGMRAWLTKRFRCRAAIALTAAYALCVLAPPMALAFADGAVAAHCLIDHHDSVAHVHAQRGVHEHGLVHTHEDGKVHKHSNDSVPAKGDGSKQPNHAGSCCGLFCFAAMTSDGHVVIGQPVHASTLFLVLDEHLVGRDPDRINRPPIAPPVAVRAGVAAA